MRSTLPSSHPRLFSIHPESLYSDVLAKVIANPEAMARLGKNHQPGKFKAYAYKGGLNVDNTSGAIPKVTFNKYGLQLMFQLTGFDQSAMISAEVSDNSAPPPLCLYQQEFSLNGPRWQP